MSANASIPGLFTAFMHIVNHTMTPQVFNHWYEDIHMPEGISANVSNLVLRYTNYTIGQPEADVSSYSTQYLSIWKLNDLNDWNSTSKRAKMPRSNALFPDGGKENMLVTTWVDLKSSVWRPIQRFDGRSNMTDTPAFIIVSKTEPAKGREDDLDQWYRKQVRIAARSGDCLTSLAS